MKSYTHCLLSLPLLPLFAAAVYADPQISYNELHTRPIDRVPEKPRVTDRFTTHANAAADGYVDILDQIPENFVFIGSGKIRVSDRVSRGGVAMSSWVPLPRQCLSCGCLAVRTTIPTLITSVQEGARRNTKSQALATRS